MSLFHPILKQLQVLEFIFPIFCFVKAMAAEQTFYDFLVLWKFPKRFITSSPGIENREAVKLNFCNTREVTLLKFVAKHTMPVSWYDYVLSSYYLNAAAPFFY